LNNMRQIRVKLAMAAATLWAQRELEVVVREKGANHHPDSGVFISLVSAVAVV
jgi:hypothetical protein